MNGVSGTLEHRASDTATRGEDGYAATEITTLYDLMASMQDQAPRQEQDFIVPTVLSWLKSGRVKFLRQASNVLPGLT